MRHFSGQTSTAKRGWCKGFLIVLQTSYYSVYGRVLGHRNSGGRTDYLSDALGNVVATIDNTGGQHNSYRYKPYGRTLAKVGSAPDSRYLWVGSWGYSTSSAAFSEVYVRARHFSNRAGQFTTVDKLGGLNQYSYVNGRVMTWSDPSGHVPVEAVFIAFINRRLAQRQPPNHRPLPPGGTMTGHDGMYYDGDFWLYSRARTPGVNITLHEAWGRTDRNFTENGAARYWPFKLAIFVRADSLDIGGTMVAGAQLGESEEILIPSFERRSDTGSQGGGYENQGHTIFRQGKCRGYTHFRRQGCTPFLPLALQVPRYCINIEGTISMTALAGRVWVNVQVLHDAFPDYEALISQPRPIKHFYRKPTRYHNILDGGLAQSVSAVATTEVHVPTAECCP